VFTSVPRFHPPAYLSGILDLAGMVIMFDRVRRLFSASAREARLQEYLERLRQRLPVPVFWLFGKTQSGKTSLIKSLTGAEAAEIGKGFQPCTRFSREYQFPLRDAASTSRVTTPTTTSRDSTTWPMS
jgi:hypothetical protein